MHKVDASGTNFVCNRHFLCRSGKHPVPKGLNQSMNDKQTECDRRFTCLLLKCT